MDLLLFEPREYGQLYNCSGFDADRVPKAERIHVFHSVLLIALFLLFELLYFPCMISLYWHLDNSCYKLLFYIGVTDMLVMLMNGLETGWLGLSGTVFCDSPTFIYVTGGIGLALWFAETSAELLLAINRCLELLKPELAHRVFKGNRTWWLCVIPSVYALVLLFMFEPILFSGIYFSWFFNPYVGYVDDFGKIYYNHAHTAHDTFVIFGLSTIYIVFSILLTVRTHNYDDQHRPTFAQKMTFLQVVVISFFNAVAAGIYIYMQNVRISDAIIIAGTYAWLLAHGTPPFVYLLLNKTIRTDFMLCLKLLTHRGHSNSRVFVLTASGTAANNRQQMLAQHHHGGVRFASQQPNQLAPIEVTSRAITEF